MFEQCVASRFAAGGVCAPFSQVAGCVATRLQNLVAVYDYGIEQKRVSTVRGRRKRARGRWPPCPPQA
eukprot:3160132-Lingulodinium_polyedra.AAC.1